MVWDRLKASQVNHHIYFQYTPCLTDFTFEFIRRPTPPILSPSSRIFVELTLVNWCPIPFVSVILATSKTWSSVSPYLLQSRYRYCRLLILWYSTLWPSQMLQHWMNLTEWAQSIFPLRGRTNPALGADASTYSIGIPEHTFSGTVLSCDGWCYQSICRM
jgi:hypothetical protein